MCLCEYLARLVVICFLGDFVLFFWKSARTRSHTDTMGEEQLRLIPSSPPFVFFFTNGKKKGDGKKKGHALHDQTVKL